MEDEALSSRPESPKKKMKSNPATDSEAQPSNYSESSSNSKRNGGLEENSIHINGLAPTRRGRFSLTPDSSSERIRNDNVENTSPPRIQEEEVSSSENFVGRGNEMSGSVAEGAADSVSKESEELTSICDSASSDSNDKH